MAIFKGKKQPEPAPTAASLQERVTAARDELTAANRELADAKAASDQAEVDAVLAGETFDMGFRARVADAAKRVADAEALIRPLQIAERQRANEQLRETAEQERLRVAELALKYRDAIVDLVATLRAHRRAQQDADAIWEQFPSHGILRAQVRVIAFPELVIGDAVYPEQSMRLLMFEQQLCQIGYADALEPDSIGRLRYDHSEAHDERHRQRAIAEQAKRLKAAEPAEPMTPQSPGHRRGRITLNDFTNGQPVVQASFDSPEGALEA